MNARNFALLFGILFLLGGIAGFIPGLLSEPHANHPRLVVNQGYGLLLNLLPVNILHNLVHVVFGIWGLLSFRRLAAALYYARGVAIIYAVLAVIGLIPGLNTLFGLVPLFGHDVWFHALIAAVAAYFGFVQKPVEDRRTAYPEQT